MKKPKITKHGLRKSVLPAIITIQFLLLAVMGCYLHITKQSADDSATLKIRGLILQAVDALLTPTHVDAQTGKVYIYEYKIVFPPAPDGSYNMMYYYLPPDKDIKPELNLIDRFTYSAAKSKVYAAQSMYDVFEQVPKLQACARGYLVVFDPIQQYQTERTELFHKKLKDGRTAYFYLDNRCTISKAKMTPYLKQVESY